MDKVSIIVPVYNAENSINRCIDSILNQSYENIELLLINDGSKDKSLQVINQYNDKRIIIIDKKNEGVAKTRNLGIKKATGKYIMFIDNDDFIDEDYVKTYVDDISTKDCDLVIGGYRRVNTSGKVLFYKKPENYEWTKYIIMAPWAKIFNREFLLKHKVQFLDYCIGEDVYFMLSLFSYDPKIDVIEYIGYNWFYNDKSVSNTIQRGFNKKVDILYLLDKINNFYKTRNEYLNYYFYKYYVWYLLFSGRTANKSEFLNEQKRIKKWLKNNNIKKSISSFSCKLRGESFSHRVSVGVFLLIDKLQLMRFFASIYCRGGRDE